MVWCDLIFILLWGYVGSVAWWVPWVCVDCGVGKVAALSIFAVASEAKVEALNEFSLHIAVGELVLQSGVFAHSIYPSGRQVVGS